MKLSWRPISHRQTVHDWNVIVTITDRHFRSAWELLGTLGDVGRTHYYNVLALKVDDVHGLLETMHDWMDYPDTRETVARVAPVFDAFDFQSTQEFEAKAQQYAEKYLGQLAGHGFHVRMHRRGFKERMATPDEERFLGDYLFEKLAGAGTPGRVDFADPDYILAVETLDNRAGLALWSREELQRYPFLKLD